MKEEITAWLDYIHEQDGTPPDTVVAFNFGLYESEEGFLIYLAGAFEYTEDNDDWAVLAPPTKDYRYLKLPDEIQKESQEVILKLTKSALSELEIEGILKMDLLKNAKAITTGFDGGKLVKIR